MFGMCGTNLSQHSLDELLAVERRLNDRPRKILGWLTPADVLKRSVTDPTPRPPTAPPATEPAQREGCQFRIAAS